MDRLLGGRVQLFQPRHGYRAAIDPVLLAAAVAARPGDRVADLGTGVGTAALCLAARVEGLALTGVEAAPVLAGLAQRNAMTNGCAERFQVIEADIRTLPAALHGAFDQVMMNPPYQRAGSDSPAPDPVKRRANAEQGAVLADWIGAASRLLQPRGTLTVIHRADRLDDLLAALHGRFGSLAVLPLRPRAGADASRVIVAARRGGRGPLRLLPGLALHGPGQAYSAAAEAVLRDAAPIPL